MTFTDTTLRATSRHLIGRADALARLEERYDEAVRSARVRTMFVEGPAGIGKTRVVEELAERVRRGGGDVLAGRCLAQGHETLPYAPWVEALSGVVRHHGGDRVRAWAGPTGDELVRLVPMVDPTGTTSEPTRASASRLFQAVRSVLEALAGRHPLLLLVEDVHWADPSSREMLALVTAQVQGPVLLAMTLRTDEATQDPALIRFTADLGGRTDQRIVLKPLRREEQARQISDILGVPPTRDVLDGVFSRAEGNPFFAEELLALGPAGSLPASIRELFMTRLSSLAPRVTQVLRTIAVIGRRAPQGLLEEVCDVTGERLEAALRSAVAAHVLVTDLVDGGGYSFRHALLQEAVADSLLPGEAARLHARVARTLTEQPGLARDSTFLSGRIARHWLAADDHAFAVVASLEAAREAKQALAFSESLSLYEQVLDILTRHPADHDLLDEQRYWLFWAAAEVAHLAGRPGRAASLAREAIGCVDEDAVDHRAYLHERLGRYLWMAADGHGALAAYEAAYALLPEDEPTRWRAAVLSGYSQILMLASRFEESLVLAEAAIEIARAVPDGRSVEGHARCNRGVDLARLGRFDEGVADLLAARRIAEEEFDDVDDIARAVVNLQSVQADAGHLEDAARVAVESIAVVDGLGLRRRKGVWCRCDAAQVLTLLGRYAEAMPLLQEAEALRPEGVDAVRTDIELGTLFLRLGRLDEARSCLERGERDGTHLLDGQLVGPLYAGLVECAASSKDFTAAETWAARGADRLSPTEDAAYAMPFYAAAVDARTEQDLTDGRRPRVRSDEATPAQAWLDRARGSVASTPAATPVAEALLLTATCSAARPDSSPDAWLAAAEAWGALGAPYHRSLAQLRAAEAMLQRGADRSTTHDLLGEAWATVVSLHSVHLVVTAESLARRARLRLGDPEPADDSSGHRLTPREREVLELVAEGLSDREVGARLFISHRTVERHVSNLLAKLDCRRRAELSAVAHREGLLAGP